MEESLAAIAAAATALAARYTDEDKPKEPDPAIATHFADLFDFVVNGAMTWWDRAPSDKIVWCDQWWKHPEAIRRLEALWRVYELNHHHRRRKEDLDWLADLDKVMETLTSPTGTFRNCRGGHMARDEYQAQTWPPTAWFQPHRWTVGAQDPPDLVKRLPQNLDNDGMRSKAQTADHTANKAAAASLFETTPQGGTQ